MVEQGTLCYVLHHTVLVCWYTVGVIVVCHMKVFRKKMSPREVIAKRKTEGLDAVKEQYPGHIADRKAKEEEMRAIAAFDASRVEKMADWVLREEQEEEAYQEQNAFYSDITSDTKFYQNKRWKELCSAIQEELREIREHIEHGEDIAAILQDGKYTYFDEKEVVQLITHTVKNLRKNVDLKERLTSALDAHLEQAEEMRRIERTIKSFKWVLDEKAYCALLEPGAFKYFSQQDIARRIVQGGFYFSEELFDAALRSLQQEGKLEESQKKVVSDVSGLAEDDNDDGAVEVMQEDVDSEHADGSDGYAHLLKRTDVYTERGQEKSRQREQQEIREIDDMLSEVLYGTSDVSEVESIKSHRYRADNAISGNDPYHIGDHRVNIYAASRVFRNLLEKSYMHITREAVAAKIRNALEEVGDDALYVALRRSIRDLRRKEEYDLRYDTDKEDALIATEKRAIESEERLEIMRQWMAVLDRSFFNGESAQDFAKERRVCVEEVQRMLTALIHREQSPDQQGGQVPMEEYQRGLIQRFLKGVVYLPRGEGEYDEFMLKNYFQPEEIAAMLLYAVEEKEDQELYDAISEIVVQGDIDPNTNYSLWARDMRQAWQSLMRKSFLNGNQSQEFAEGRKQCMQKIYSNISFLVGDKIFDSSLLYGGGYGGYYGYRYTTPKEVAAMVLYAIEVSGKQKAYDVLMWHITQEEGRLQEGYQEAKEQEQAKKDEMKKYRTKNQGQAKNDLRQKREVKRVLERAEQAVAAWKEQVGI